MLSALLALPGVGLSQTPPQNLAENYLNSLEEVLRETATAQDVDRLMFLYSVDVVYEHSRVGALVRGRDEITKQMTGMLGLTRNPDTRVHGSTKGEGVVVIDYTLKMEIRSEAGWRAIERRQITVLETNADGRVKRVLEYW